MAILQSCCLCCNLRTGSFISAIYSTTGTIIYLLLLVIRNVGYDLVDKYEAHKSATVASIVVLCCMTLVSLFLMCAIPSDNFKLCVPWMIITPITILSSSSILVYITVYDLRNNIPVEFWEKSIITLHVLHTVIMVMCIVCVYCHCYDLYTGKGTAEYYRELMAARQRALSAIFGVDAFMGVPGVDSDYDGSQAYNNALGVPPPAYSELSSRRTAERNPESTTNATSRQRGGDRPLSNPPSGTNTPTGTVRSSSTARSRPRPSSLLNQQPPSEIGSSLAPSTLRGGDGSLVYMNFEDDRSENNSNFSRPQTLARDESVARINVTETMLKNKKKPKLDIKAADSSDQTGNTSSTPGQSSSVSNQGGDTAGPSTSSENSTSETKKPTKRVRQGTTGDSTGPSRSQHERSRPSRGRSAQHKDRRTSSNDRHDNTRSQSHRNNGLISGLLHQETPPHPPPSYDRFDEMRGVELNRITEMRRHQEANELYNTFPDDDYDPALVEMMYEMDIQQREIQEQHAHAEFERRLSEHALAVANGQYTDPAYMHNTAFPM